MSNKPRHVRQGETLSARWLNQLVDAVAGMITGTRGITVARGPGGIVIQGPEAPTRPLEAPRPFAARIEGVFNDYLSVRRITKNGANVGDAFNVAKPYKLRHVVTNYTWPTSLTTDNPNQVTVSNGSETYVWKVSPDGFVVTEPVQVVPVVFSGVFVDGVDLKFEVDAGQRMWAAEDAQ